MEYPEDFPDDLRSYVEAAIAQAELDLIDQRKRLGPRFEEKWQGVLLLWVKAIFFEFAERACDMGRRGNWSAEKIRIETAAYLKKLAARARTRHAPPSTPTNPYLVELELKKIGEAVTQFDEWATFQERLKRVIEESINRGHAPLITEFDIAPPPMPIQPNLAILPGILPLMPRASLTLPVPATQPPLRERMEKCATVLGIKKFCEGAGISLASYHKIRHDTGGKKVLAKVESFLEFQSSLKNSKKV